MAITVYLSLGVCLYEDERLYSENRFAGKRYTTTVCNLIMFHVHSSSVSCQESLSSICNESWDDWDATVPCQQKGATLPPAPVQLSI